MSRRKTRRRRLAEIEGRREQRAEEKKREQKLAYQKWKSATKIVKLSIRGRVPEDIPSKLRAKVPGLFMTRQHTITEKLGEWNEAAREKGEEEHSLEDAMAQYVMECVGNGDLSPLEGEPEKGDLIVVLR